jgi:hypothetical protein
MSSLIVIVLACWFVVRPWYLHWGATEAEVAMKLPGDEIVPDRNSVSTRAITVRAPASEIYPWLVQVGQGRGGMYSYEWLENLAGCDMHNVYRIVPALQQVSDGQVVRMGPKGYPMYHVAGLEPGKYFVMQPADPKTEQPGPGAWTMAVVEQPDGTSRMIFRQQMRVDPGIGNFVMWRVVIDPMSFVMEQKMMRTIRDLAEQAG